MFTSKNIFDMAESLVGVPEFDSIFNTLDAPKATHTKGFPPYNVISYGDGKNPGCVQCVYEIAVAGYSKDEITVKLRDDSNGTEIQISGKKEVKYPETEKLEARGQLPLHAGYVYNGIAARAFRFNIPLRQDMKLGGVTLANGILTITIDIVKQNKDSSVEIIEIK